VEGRPSEGGGPGFLGHGDLVWICRDADGTGVTLEILSSEIYE